MNVGDKVRFTKPGGQIPGWMVGLAGTIVGFTKLDGYPVIRVSPAWGLAVDRFGSAVPADQAVAA